MAMLTGLARAWWDWCAPVSLQVAFLFVVAAALERLLRRWRSPRMLAALWLLPFVRIVIPPGFGSEVSLLDLGGTGWPSVAALFPSGGESTSVAGEEEAVTLFLLWLSGVALCGAACLWRCCGLRRLWLGSSHRPASREVERLAGEAARRLQLHRLPEIRIAPGASGPAVVGFLRVVVVLPARLVRLATRRELAHVLVHELAHVKRRDPLLQLLGVLVQIVFWFHPCLWLARRRLSAVTELCCDRTVTAALGGSGAAYRRTLLRLARSTFLTEPLGSLAFLRRGSRLLERIEWLDRQEEARRNPRRGRWSPLCGRTLAGGLCALAIFSSVPPARPAGPAAFAPPPLESLRGCLQLRYAVQAALARESVDPGPFQTLVSPRRES